MHLWEPALDGKRQKGIRNMDYLNLDTGVIWTITLFAGTLLIAILAIWDLIKTETLLREAGY